MDLIAVGCFAPIIFAIILLGIHLHHYREVRLRIKALQDGLLPIPSRVPEGEAMPHDMNALMWYDI